MSTHPLVSILATDISLEDAGRFFWTSDSALKQGAHIMGGPGSGKSRFIGRVLVWLHLLRRLAGLVLDPTGQVTNNVFDKLSRLPYAEGQALAKQILYIDMGNEELVVPSPLYRRHSAAESYEEIA